MNPEDEHTVTDAVQRIVIRIACATFAIILGTFAVVAGALASKHQAVYVGIGLAAIVLAAAVIRVELRRKQRLE